MMTRDEEYAARLRVAEKRGAVEGAALILLGDVEAALRDLDSSTFTAKSLRSSADRLREKLLASSPDLAGALAVLSRP